MVKRVLVKWWIFLFFSPLKHSFLRSGNSVKTFLKPFKQFFFTVKTPLIHPVFTVGIQLIHVFFTSWKHHCNTQMLVICLTGNKRCFIWLWRVLFCPTTEKLPEVNGRLSYCHWKKWRHTLLPSPMTYMVWAGRPIREEVHYVCIS